MKEILKATVKKEVLIMIVLLSVALRFIAINQSLWLDEAIGALVVKNQSYFEILTRFPRVDNHPPLYYLTLKAWTNIFGYSEIALRSLSVLFGAGTVFLTYKIGFLLKKNSNFAFFAALILATSQFHIYYSQEARMYSQAAFFASLAIYSFIFLVKKDTKKHFISPWIVFSLAITGLVFTDYVPVFMLPVFWIYAIYKRKKWEWWVNFLSSHIVLVLIGIFWRPIFLIQSENGRALLQTLPAWRELAGGATLRNLGLVWTKFSFGRISFMDKTFYYLLLLVLSIPFSAFLIRAWSRRKGVEIIWFWFFIPLTLGFLASFSLPIFIYFRFLYVMPAFILLIVWGIENFKKMRKIFLTFMILINAGSLLVYAINPYQQREKWRQAVEFIQSEANDGDIVLFTNPEPFAPYQWYSSRSILSFGATDSISANKVETLERTSLLVENASGIYYFEYLNDLHDPNSYVLEAISGSVFEKASVSDFVGVGHVYYYSRPN